MFTKITLVALLALVPALSGTTDAPIEATSVITIQPGIAASGGTI